MESKIQVGEYIRTIYGIIAKVINPEYYIELYIECEGGKLIQKGNIKKHSLNIIDLIEEEDYVNGRLILQVDCKIKRVCLLVPFADTMSPINAIWIKSQDIRSIVTKEQFESMEYEV